jgi:hypothetical protein
LVYIRIVSVINLRVSMYSVVLQYFIYYVIIMITYLLCVCIAAFCEYYKIIYFCLTMLHFIFYILWHVDC